MSTFLSSCCKSKENTSKVQVLKGHRTVGGWNGCRTFESRCLVEWGTNGSLCQSEALNPYNQKSLKKLLLVFPTAERLLGCPCSVTSLKGCLSVLGLIFPCLICSSVKRYLLCTQVWGKCCNSAFFSGISCVLVTVLPFRSEIHSLTKQHTWKTNCLYHPWSSAPALQLQITALKDNLWVVYRAEAGKFTNSFLTEINLSFDMHIWKQVMLMFFQHSPLVYR